MRGQPCAGAAATGCIRCAPDGTGACAVGRAADAPCGCGDRKSREASTAEQSRGFGYAGAENKKKKRKQSSATRFFSVYLCGLVWFGLVWSAIIVFYIILLLLLLLGLNLFYYTFIILYAKQRGRGTQTVME